MNKYLIHIVINIFSIISYIYLNDINIAPLTMISCFIKYTCCSRSIKDEDMVSQPESLSVPYEDIKKVADAAENVIDEVIAPQTKTVKEVIKVFDSKSNN